MKLMLYCRNLSVAHVLCFLWHFYFHTLHSSPASTVGRWNTLSSYPAWWYDSFGELDKLILANKFVREKFKNLGLELVPGETLDSERRRFLAENQIVKSINGKQVGVDISVDEIASRDKFDQVTMDKD